MASLQQAIDFARVNPNTPKSRELRRRIEAGQMDAVALREGIQLPGRTLAPTTQIPPIAEDIKEIGIFGGIEGETAGERVRRIQAERAGQPSKIPSVGETVGKLPIASGIKTAIERGSETVETGLRQFGRGKVLEGLFDIGGGAIGTIGETVAAPVFEAAKAGTKLFAKILSPLKPVFDAAVEGMRGRLVETLGEEQAGQLQANVDEAIEGAGKGIAVLADAYEQLTPEGKANVNASLGWIDFLGASKFFKKPITEAVKEVVPLVKAGAKKTGEFVEAGGRVLKEATIPTPREVAARAATTERAAALEVKAAAEKITVSKEAAAEADRLVGVIAQAEKKDFPKFKRALQNVDTAKVKTFDDFTGTIQARSDALAKKVDDVLLEDKRVFGKKDFNLEAKTPTGKIRQNFVVDSLDDLDELYTKTGAIEDAARIRTMKAKLNKEGLSLKEVNDLSREYRRDFGKKAFGKTGEPLTSTNAAKFENTRKRLKDQVREKFEGDAPKELDRQLSELISLRDNIGDLAKKAQKTVNKAVQQGKAAKVAEILGTTLEKILQVSTLGIGKPFLQKIGGTLLPKLGGVKGSLSILELEKDLAKNLKRLDELVGK